MSTYVISAPGALQPEMRGGYVDENASASSALLVHLLLQNVNDIEIYMAEMNNNYVINKEVFELCIEKMDLNLKICKCCVHFLNGIRRYSQN
jgi:hypothetical protein